MHQLAMSSPQVVTETPAGPCTPSPEHHTPGACRGVGAKQPPCLSGRGTPKALRALSPKLAAVVSTGRVQGLALALLPGDPGDPHQPLAEDALVFQELALQLTSPHPLRPTDRLGAGGKAQSGVWGGLAPDRRQRTAGTQPPASTAPQWLRNPLPGWAEGACYWAETSHCS